MPGTAPTGGAASHAGPVAIVGGGPAGLFAAEVLRSAGCEVHVFEAMGSVGRKFLVAGKGGLNLTHSDPPGIFASRYRERAGEVGRWLGQFGAPELREWARGLGVPTFVGTSGRVFPEDLKAAPLLRGWVRRLRADGVHIHVNHRWTGWTGDGALRFRTPEGEHLVTAAATVLALGGASWPQLGSDGAWTGALLDAGLDIAPLQPANCGFDVAWSRHFADRYAGAPLKPVVAHWREAGGGAGSLQGEAVVTAHGIEGSLVYALSAMLRAQVAQAGEALLELDLVPGREQARLQGELSRPRGKRSLSEHLRRAAGIDGVKAALLREVLGPGALGDPGVVAAAAKRLPLRLRAPRPVAEAISTAGGLRLEELDGHLMVRRLPGTFAAGEMLDWEAPTGGYLLTACFASGRQAAQGVLRWLSGEVGGTHA